jgi:PAS domain S-box-containing protein
MGETSAVSARVGQGVLGMAALAGLYLSSLYSYLLFHCLAEMFSIVVACGIFVLGWNSRRYMRSDYLVFLSIAYLFIAFLDLLHTLSYKGMSIFTDYDFYANQLWIATRGMESLSLLLAFTFVGERRRLSPSGVFAGFAAVTAVIVASIFWWKIFPVCFVEGVGQTAFKKYSEYVICAILFLSLLILMRMRSRFEPSVHRALVLSLVFTIGAELSFTFYISNYGFSNLMGHYLKILSFFFIYKAIIETGIRKPYDLIFRRLAASEARLKRSQLSARLGDFDYLPASGRMIWSDQAYRLFGYLPGEAKPSFELFLGHVHPIHRDSVEAIVATPPEMGMQDMLIRFTQVDGGERWGRLSFVVEPGENGEGSHLFAALQDVTELTQSRHTMEWQLDVNGAVAGCMESLLSSRYTVDDLSDIILHEVLRLSGSRHGFVASVDRQSRAVTIHRQTDSLEPEGTWDRRAALIAQGTHAAHPYYANTPGELAGFAEVGTDVSRFLVAPGSVGGTLRGLVAVADRDEPYTDHILHAVSRFANIFVLALDRQEGEQALARRDAMLQGFLNGINETALLLAPDGTVLFSNRAAARRLGTTEEALTGANLWPLLPPEVARTREAKVLKACSTGVEERFEDSRNGRTFENIFCPLMENGTAIAVAALGFDITRRKQAELELIKLKRSVEHSPISIVITDTDGVIEYVNPAFSRITGYAREEVAGRSQDFLHSEVHDGEFFRNAWETVAAGKTWASEVCSRKKSGELFWEQVTVSPVRNSEGRIVNYLAVKEDISDRKDLDRLKEDVERTMRHDLKTPLSGIIGMPRVLEMDDNLTEEQRDVLKIIEESGERMLRMIDLSLDMFKMELGTYEHVPEPVDVLTVLRRLEKQMRMLIVDKSLTVRATLDGVEAGPDASFVIQSEDRLLHPLLSNLLANAAEASPEGGTIELMLVSAAPPRLSMRNAGVVPSVLREHFFEKYKTYGKSSGTGLGTYSAKLLADAMGYGIAMQTSDADNATTITITFPEDQGRTG